jgi:ABC-type branched-subunit amino acid transport system substrate-binding protein
VPTCSHTARALGRTALALLLLLGLAAIGSAQPERIVMGVVLPESDHGSAWTQAVTRSADEGAAMVAEEFAFNAEMFGLDFEVAIERGSGVDGAVAAAERLVADRGAFAVIGGFGDAEAEALGGWSAERGLPFLNVGASLDLLRNEACAPTAFHVEPSAAMYIDGLAGWYVRSGFRRWFLVVADDPEGAALQERIERALRERHFCARVVGARPVPAGGGDPAATATAAGRANADLVVLLVSAEDQLRWLAELDAAGLQAEVAGFPHPETQTRAFFQASRDASPRLGASFRSLAFEATLDAYGARELNARYRARFDRPMEPAAWAVYQAVKMLFEAATFGGSIEPDAVLAYLTAPTTVFDLYKGIGTSFRPWDRQLRQSIFLVGLSATDPDPFTMAILVGELPAIYLPGTELLERLDQIGDLQDASRCRP